MPKFQLTEEHVALIRVAWRGGRQHALLRFHSLSNFQIEERRRASIKLAALFDSQNNECPF